MAMELSWENATDQKVQKNMLMAQRGRTRGSGVALNGVKKKGEWPWQLRDPLEGRGARDSRNCK